MYFNPLATRAYLLPVRLEYMGWFFVFCFLLFSLGSRMLSRGPVSEEEGASLHLCSVTSFIVETSLATLSAATRIPWLFLSF